MFCFQARTVHCLLWTKKRNKQNISVVKDRVFQIQIQILVPLKIYLNTKIFKKQYDT
jgi:hypothetical protein